jgi:hypothetical protein
MSPFGCISFLTPSASAHSVRLYRNFKDYVTVDELDVTLIFAKEGSALNKDSRSHEKFVHGIKLLSEQLFYDSSLLVRRSKVTEWFRLSIRPLISSIE